MKPSTVRLISVSSLYLLLNAAVCLSQTAGITSGAIYTLASKASGRVLDVGNSSMANGGNVDTWTNTTSDAERWMVTYLGNSLYTLTNVGSGNLLHSANATPANSVNVDQSSSTNDNTIKWNIADAGNGYYQLASAAGPSFLLDLANGTNADGANVQLWTSNNSDPQKWLFQMQTAQNAAPTAAIADEIFAAWKAKYYTTNTTGGSVSGEGFWGVADIMEIVDDAYEVTGFAKYRDMFAELYNGFVAQQGSDWAWNEYNDDITWAVIACVRAALLTGNQTYLAKAKQQYDQMYARAWTTGYGGGLLWKQGLTTKNACINGPAMVAAMYLGQATGDTTYFTKATQIYTWSKAYLFVRSTGKVNDNYDGTVGNWSSTYNQGTYLGAAVMLYDHTKDTTYRDDALKIADYTQNAMFGSSVINSESGPDLDGFKGILMRYARRYVVDLNRPDYIPWLQLNAKVAYNNRDTSGIIGTLWGTRTSDTATCAAFSASTAVSLMLNCPLSTTITRDAYSTIEAENFDYLKGIIVEKTADTGGVNQVGGIMDGYYTAYMNVDFGSTGATKAEFRVSCATDGGTIEIRLGGITGTLIGTAVVTSTGSWTVYTTVSANVTKTTGLQNVYLVYKGAGYVCNLNHFRFIEATSTNAYAQRISGMSLEAIHLNSAQTQLRINPGSAKADKLSITNLLGRTMFQDTRGFSGIRTLDVSEYPRGVYFVTLEANHVRINGKVILK
jgi:predicted alpha-1,6-mannanase (GH76 family)